MKKKKSKLQKKKDNPNSLYWRTRALKQWREICLAKFDNECLICKSTEQLECHHPISKKTCKALMFNTDNMILLCSKHHNWFGTDKYPWSAHKSPLQFYRYLQEYYPDLHKDIYSIDVSKEEKTTKEYYNELKILNEL